MADKAMDVYLNDHLAGSILGADLASQIKEMNEDTPLAGVMAPIVLQIEEDRETLVALMERMGTSKNPVKQVSAWVAEKASRVKFSGLTSGETEQGTFMALESLTLGVRGKACLWTTLLEVAERYDELDPAELQVLVDLAESQAATLEAERQKAARRAFEGRNA